jgi:hypothetical protein
VDVNGLPIAVEVKLRLNGEARREVVAQVIDYLSSLTELTVEELDRAVNGQLEAALTRLAKDEDEEFDRLWECVGANLRAGKARMVVALDEAPASLERIFRFLARNSSLDVQLLTVQRYSSALGDVIVPQLRVNPVTERKPTGHARTTEIPSELLAACDAYNASAPPDLRASGNPSNYRTVRFDGFGHYIFRQKKACISVAVHGFAEQAVRELLKTFSGTSIGNSQVLMWRDGGYKGLGRLKTEFPLDTSAETIAQAMRDLLALTQAPIAEVLRASKTELGINQPSNGTASGSAPNVY